MERESTSATNLQQTEVKPLVHELTPDKKGFAKKRIFNIFIIILLGIFSGFGLSKVIGQPQQSTSQTGVTGGENKAIPSVSAQTFSDSAEGQLEASEAGAEGSHKLVRPGGVSQTVYLTSSVLDLSEYVGKKVKVWGQTFSAKKAGWLMDVGKVEVLP